MKSLRLVWRYQPAALLALAAFGLAVTGSAGTAPAASAAVRAPQARVLNPSPPTGLTAVAGDGRVSLSWSPPTSNGGAAIIGYDVFRNGGAVSGLVGGTSFTVTGLTNGTTYSFTVDAVNDAELHSAQSGPASATPAAPVTVPGAPGGLSATAGDARVSLSWQAPSADGGAAITSYNVYQGGKRAATVTGTGATMKNLANGTTYSFTVTAVNQAGEGPASRGASATPTAAITRPGAPNGLAASPGDGKVTLSWSPPKSTGGAAITSYNVYQGGKRVAGVRGTGATVTNLANGTTYSFTVTAVNQAGEGPASGAASVKPTAGASASASASATAPVSGSASASASASAGASASGSASSSGSATPAGGAGASGTPAGTAGPSGQQTGAAVLTSATKKLPKPVLFTLAALALAAVGGALTLTTRRVRKGRRTKRPPAAPPVDVRAVPEAGPPSPVSVHEFSVEHHEPGVEHHEPGEESHEVFMAETYTVRLEPLPAAIITTFEEIGA